jgi:protein TonB
MSYLDHTLDPRRRGIAIAGVAGIQALLAYILITGLAVQIVPRIWHNPTGGVQVPLPPPPAPTPTPTPTPTARHTVERVEYPRDPVPKNPPLPPSLNDNSGDRGTGGTRTGEFPLPPPPPPPPHPAFTIKGASPIGNPASWAMTDDYPARDLDEGHEGTTVFHVTVGADGRVSGCDIVRSSGFRGLDLAKCRAVTKRARFRPATDGNGQAVAGSYSNSVRWQIPR